LLNSEAFSTALRAALAALPTDEAEARLRELREAGLIGGAAGPAPDQVPEAFEPLLQAIATVAQGDDSPRAQIEQALAELEQKGWRLSEPVRRLWAGERDAAALTAGLDAQDGAIIRRALALAAS
jgi:hypothetical protein